MEKKKKLTGKEEKFIQVYCINGFNGTQAAIEAGYKKGRARQTAHDLVSKGYIQERIDEYKKQEAEKNSVTMAGIIKDLREIQERCMQKEAVMEYDHNDKCMKESGEWTFKENGALKAVELIGKTIGAFSLDNDSVIKTINLELNKKDMKQAIKEVFKKDDV